MHRAPETRWPHHASVLHQVGDTRSLAPLVSPPRANLTRFHDVFAPGAKLRPFVRPPKAEANPKPKRRTESGATSSVQSPRFHIRQTLLSPGSRTGPLHEPLAGRSWG
ncbi:hypothetical protein F0U63_41250 [Cystobacter fuscus]|nr:hypothetical protein F0U63_41250 [Cystobacter fuscus]